MSKGMGMNTLHKGFWEDKHTFSGFHSSVMWPPTVYELVWPQGLFGWPPDHMVWFALLLLVKFKTPGWFYIMSYSYQVVHFGDWDHCVKVLWVTRSKSKVSRPLFSLLLVAGDMICFVVKSENLMKRGLWNRLVNGVNVFNNLERWNTEISFGINKKKHIFDQSYKILYVVISCKLICVMY